MVRFVGSTGKVSRRDQSVEETSNGLEAIVVPFRIHMNHGLFEKGKAMGSFNVRFLVSPDQV